MSPYRYLSKRRLLNSRRYAAFRAVEHFFFFSLPFRVGMCLASRRGGFRLLRWKEAFCDQEHPQTSKRPG